MKYYEEFINESKQVGIIYHYTSIDSMFSILNDDNINPSFPDKTGYYISFTRDKNFLNRNFNLIGNGEINCRFVVDGNKISNNYKVEPYDYFAHIKLKSLNTSKRGTIDYSDEQEERLYLKSENSKFPVFKYTIKIELLMKPIQYIFNKKNGNETAFKHIMKKTASYLGISIDVLFDMDANEFVSEIIKVVNKKYNIKVVLV